MPNAAPYKIEKRGDKFVVLNNLGDVKATFKDRSAAEDYLQALYANVPGAQKKAAKTKFSGKAKSAEELAARWAPTLGKPRREAAQRDFTEPLADPVEDLPVEVVEADTEGLLPQAPGTHPVIDAPQITPLEAATTGGQAITLNGLISTSTGLSGAFTSPVLPPATVPVEAAPEISRAFTTEVNGKTILTAPASTFHDSIERAAATNKHFLWMTGRFVGAEQANRNNAFWSSGDLELGHTTVANGPLNWLHEARHVIGTIAKADFIPGAPVQQAAETVQPHIQATSAIWAWIYPDEAWVVEQASDAGKLWYSMECISDSVKCKADGCNAEVAYGAYLNDLGCSHMAQRSSVRHFANPTFLGGAVIVPPARPGWADADASLVKQAASMAEKAYDQAGHPDVKATEWELLMGQVLAYANA